MTNGCSSQVKKEVLILQPALGPYRIDLFNSLSDDFDLTVFCYLNRMYYMRFDLESRAVPIKFRLLYGTKLRPARWQPLLVALLVLPKIVAWILSRPRAIIILHEYSPISILLVVALRLVRRKVFVMSSDNAHIVRTDTLARVYRRTWVLYWALGVVVYIRSVLHAGRGYSVAKKIVAISPNLQNPSVFRGLLTSKQVESSASGFIDRWNLQDRKAILFVGRLSSVKNIPLLLEAFHRVGDSQARLIVVGGGAEQDKLVALAQRLGVENAVIFAGHCEGSDLYAWYRIGKLFVLPSRREPFGAVVNEALMAGMPTVCSDVAGAAELIEPGVNGDCFMSESLDDLVCKLQEWLPRVKPVKKGSGLPDDLMSTPFSSAVDSFARLLEA